MLIATIAALSGELKATRLIAMVSEKRSHFALNISLNAKRRNAPRE
jgi:hypothetical protein